MPSIREQYIFGKSDSPDVDCWYEPAIQWQFQFAFSSPST